MELTNQQKIDLRMFALREVREFYSKTSIVPSTLLNVSAFYEEFIVNGKVPPEPEEKCQRCEERDRMDAFDLNPESLEEIEIDIPDKSDSVYPDKTDRFAIQLVCSLIGSAIGTAAFWLYMLSK